MFTKTIEKIKLFNIKRQRKCFKYSKQYVPLKYGVFASFVLLLACVILYFCPSLLFYKWGFIPLTEETVKYILQICSTISGVIFGVFLQQFIEFYLLPDKDVMQPLDAPSIFREIYHSLDEFSEMMDNDKKGLLDKDTNITILLSIPILIDFDEVESVLGDRDYKTKFERKINKIFLDQDSTFKKSIYCLHTKPLRSIGVSPFQRFLKSFSGYLITEHYKEKKYKINDDTFYEFCEKVHTLRKHLTYRVNEFCRQDHIKENLKYVKEDDLQWQVLVIDAPKHRHHRAVVGFYGEDYFKQYSSLGLLNSLKLIQGNTVNQGFVSSEYDIINWVREGLITPYIPDDAYPFEIYQHHSSDVHKKITNSYPNDEGGKKNVAVITDNLKKLETCNTSFDYGRDSVIRDIEYPVYDGQSKETFILKYCQYLFHPLIAESSTFTSLNIRLPGINNGKVMDMCSGIGVQGLAAIDKGATLIHGIDNDPVSLLCTINNYRIKTLGRNNIEIYVTLADGFKIMATTFDKFEELFISDINDDKWGVLSDDKKRELLDLFEKNRKYANEIYAKTINNDFDLIILEPPFVEFFDEDLSPSHDSLFDKNFKLTKSLLRNANEYLRQSNQSGIKEWEKPYVMQSFSSLENILELEEYIEKEVKFKVFRKSCIKIHDVYWYSLHLIPNNEKNYSPKQ